MRLVDRHPHLDASTLVRRFIPPHRFEAARFENYEPDPDYPLQASARNELTRFAANIGAPKARRRFWQPKPALDAKAARYLDGSFGVGKTHLLAALWHATSADAPKAYLTFNDLTALIGFTGMATAIEVFREYSLICIDEFELDDVANTLMVVSFLRGVMIDGVHVAVTSNTLPDRLGEQRFSASDFKREIAAIAGYFDELRIDGPDYRTTHAPLPLIVHDASDDDTTTHDDFDEVLAHLSRVHPVQYAAMLDDVDTVVIDGAHQIRDQDDALLFVQLVDKLYDAHTPVRISGCEPSELFAPSYRNGGYRKKYGRAESRIIAMQAETAG